MSDETVWVRDGNGVKALIPTGDRDRWTVHGWAEGLPPVDGEFVWMRYPGLGEPDNPIPWAARAYWQGIGWQPGAPAEPVNPTRDPALSAAAVAGPEGPPDGTKDDVLAWVGDDRQRAEQALTAERERDKPRTTLVDALGRVGQPQHDDAAMTAQSNEESAERG